MTWAAKRIGLAGVAAALPRAGVRDRRGLGARHARQAGDGDGGPAHETRKAPHVQRQGGWRGGDGVGGGGCGCN